jgi:hypothetical protein
MKKIRGFVKNPAKTISKEISQVPNTVSAGIETATTHISNGANTTANHIAAGVQNLEEHIHKVGEGESPITMHAIQDEANRTGSNINSFFKKAGSDISQEWHRLPKDARDTIGYAAVAVAICAIGYWMYTAYAAGTLTFSMSYEGGALVLGGSIAAGEGAREDLPESPRNNYHPPSSSEPVDKTNEPSPSNTSTPTNPQQDTSQSIPQPKKQEEQSIQFKKEELINVFDKVKEKAESVAQPEALKDIPVVYSIEKKIEATASLIYSNLTMIAGFTFPQVATIMTAAKYIFGSDTIGEPNDKIETIASDLFSSALNVEKPAAMLMDYLITKSQYLKELLNEHLGNDSTPATNLRK